MAQTAIVAAAVTFAVDEVRTASQLCRPVMLVSLSPQLRSATVQIMRALRATALPLLLRTCCVRAGVASRACCAVVIFMVLFYALLGMVIFARTPEGDKFFPNLLRAVVSIHVLFTTCNNPDVRYAHACPTAPRADAHAGANSIPAYTNDIASALFFMSFSFIGMMFVYNLMTGFVATSYRTGAKEGMQETFELQTAAYYLAFCRLDREHRGVVDVSTIHHMLRVYSRRGDEIPLAVLAAMPTAQMGLFDLWEFQDLCDLLVFRIFKLRSPPVLARCAPRFFHGLRTVAKHRAFTVAVYVLIVSSSLVAVVHTSIVVGTLPASGTRAFLSDGRAATRTFAVIIDEWFWVHTAFMVAAVAEILVRVGGMGIRQTFSEMWFVYVRACARARRPRPA